MFRTPQSRWPRRLFRFAPPLALASLLAACGSPNGLVGLVTGPLGGSGNGTTSGTGTVSIQMTGLQFVPPTDTVGVGALVVWTNQDGVSHTVVADDGSFDSGTIPPQGSYARTFPDSGSVPYHDPDYGAPGTGMHGTIVVR